MQVTNQTAVEQYGIEETRDFVVLGCRIGNAVHHTLEDNKVTILDARHFWDVVPAFKNAIVGARFVGKELNDLSEDERQILRDTVAKELDLPSAEAEEIIEESFDVASKIILLSAKIKALRRQ